MKKHMALGLSLCLVLVVAIGITFAVTSSQHQILSHGKDGLVTSRYNFGSSGTSTLGWLVPPNTLISTTYTSTEVVNYSLIGSVDVFQSGNSGQTIRLGLYVNGLLNASSTFLTNWNNSETAATEGTVSRQVANFDFVTTEYTVAVFPSSSIPKGVTVTLAVEFSGPLWIQIDRSSSTHSYETNVSSSFNTFPAQLAADSGAISPYTLAVGMGGN